MSTPKPSSRFVLRPATPREQRRPQTTRNARFARPEPDRRRPQSTRAPGNNRFQRPHHRRNHTYSYFIHTHITKMIDPSTINPPQSTPIFPMCERIYHSKQQSLPHNVHQHSTQSSCRKRSTQLLSVLNSKLQVHVSSNSPLCEIHKRIFPSFIFV